MTELCHLSGYREVFSLYGRYTKKIIKFCKGLSSFKHLEQRDQLSILKPFHSEIISIRTAFLYDPTRDGFYILLNDDEQAAAFVPLGNYQTFGVFDLQTYCRNFLTMLNIVMEDDPVLRNLIIAQKLFDIRQNISCPQFIQYVLYGQPLFLWINLIFLNLEIRTFSTYAYFVVTLNTSTRMATWRRKSTAPLCSSSLSLTLSVIRISESTKTFARVIRQRWMKLFLSFMTLNRKKSRQFYKPNLFKKI